MKGVPWDNAKLEPVLITFNRARNLARTLDSFFAAGLYSMRLHVLDNASSDDTRTVVEQFQGKWSSLVYHRNKYNIGGNGNILRAIEVADSEYCWIIGDDDDWHLENVEALVSALRSSADVIRLGWLREKGHAPKSTFVDAARNESGFFISVCQISNVVVRRSLLAQSLPAAYMNTGDAYPHLVPLLETLPWPTVSLITLDKTLMTYCQSDEPGFYFGDLEWHSSWFRTSRFIHDPDLRRKFIGDCMFFLLKRKPTCFASGVLLTKIALKYKGFKIPQGKFLMSMAAYGDGARCAVVMASIVYLLTPGRFARAIVAAYRRWKGLPNTALKIDRSRL